MDISSSKFYLKSDNSTDMFSLFLYAWNEQRGVKNSKYFMDKIINNIKSLDSKAKGYEDDSDPENNDCTDLNFVLDRYDPTFKKLSDYFSNNTIEELKENPLYKHLNKRGLNSVIKTKICVMVYLHTASFFLNYGEYMNIDKSLKCEDDESTPVIDAIYQDIERVKNDIATKVENLFNEYPALKGKIDHHDILRVTRTWKAHTIANKLKAAGILAENEVKEIIRKINNIRTLYIDDHFYFYKDNMHKIYHAVSESFYRKTVDAIPGILRGLLPETSFYSIQSGYIDTDKISE